MSSHIKHLSEICTLVLLFLFAIGSYQTYDVLIDIFLQLPFLHDGYDPEINIKPAEMRARLENDVRYRVARLSLNDTLVKLANFHEQGWFNKISIFLRPDINMIIKTAVEGFVSPGFELPEPGSIPPYIKASRSTPLAPRGFFHSLQGIRRNAPFLAPELGQEFYLKSLHLCPSTVLVGHNRDVFCLTYDCTGHRLITGSDDSLIKVWDIKTGGLIFTLKGHNAPISDFHIFEDGQHLISCDTEGFVVLWDLAYGIVKSKRKLGRCCITNIFFMPANFGKTFSFFAAGDNGTCYHQEIEPDFFFDPDLTKISQHLYKAKKMLVACRNPTGSLIAYGGEDFMIYIAQPALKVSEEELQDVEDICRPNRLAWGAPQIKTILHGHTFSVATLEFNKSGDRLLSSSQDNTARVWSHDPSTEVWACVIMGEEIDFELDDGVVQPLEKGHRIRESMLTGLEHNICSAVWACDDNIIMVSYDSGLLRMFCSHSGHLLCSNQLSEFPIHALAPHPTKTDLVLVACYQGKVAIINARNGHQVEFWDYKEEYCFIEAKWSPNGDHFSLSAEGGKCFTYASALDIGHTVPAISGAQQCLSTDFVSLPSTSSFPMHGTETRRNEFRKYDLKTFACDTQPDIFQKPADFGKEYTCTSLTEAPCDPSTIAPLLEHLRWKSLGTTNELPKLYQYKKYRREHLGLFQEAEINEDLEPIALPKSPKDADYVQTSNASSEDDLEGEPDSESMSSSDISFIRSFSPLRTRRRARENDSPEKSPRRSRRNRFPIRATRAQTIYVESGHSQISGSESDQEIVTDPAQLEELANRMNISEYPLPDGILLDNEWAKLIDQPTGSYFPQINDPIVYLPSGHREYAANCNIEPVLARVPSIEGLPRFGLTEYGVVQEIKFYMDNSIPLAEICLKFKSGTALNVVIGPHLPRFIVHQATYDAASLRHVSQGSLVQLHGRSEHHAVTNISTDSDPWNAFQLRELEGRFGRWELYTAPPLVSLDTATVAKYTRVIRQLSQDSHFDLFVDQIDLATYPEYVSLVPAPMFLSLISLRLRNNYYRCEEAFMQDLKQIHANALAFNLPKSEIVYQAKALVVRAKALIEDIPQPKSKSSSESESSSPTPSPRRPKRTRPAKASTQKPKSKPKAQSDPEYGSEEIESLASSGSFATLDDGSEEDTEDDAPRKRARKQTSRQVSAPRKSRQGAQGRSLRPRQQVNYVSNIHFSDSSEAPPSRRPQRNIVVSDDD